jgi:hypothetical protein
LHERTPKSRWPRRRRRSERSIDALAAESFPGSDAPSLGGPSATPAGPAERGEAPAERIAAVLDEAHADLPVRELADLLALVDATGRELERGRVPADRLPAAAEGRSAAVRRLMAPVVALVREELGTAGGPPARRRRLGRRLRAEAEDVAARPRGAALAT